MSALLPFDLTEIVYEELLSGRRSNDGLLHASSHMVGPLRHAQLDVAGAPSLPEGLIRQVPMWTGTMWHEWLQGRLKQLGVPVMMEVKLSPWLPKGWGGTADLFVYNPEYRAFVLVDLKTTKGDGLKWIRKDGAKPEHMHQVSAYWWAAKKMGIPLTKHAAIYYLPMTDTRDRNEVVEPILCEITPLPMKMLHAEMRSRQEAVAAYVDSLPFGTDPNGPALPLEDYLTPELAPVPDRVQALQYDKRAGQWNLQLKPHWSSMFCTYPLELCDCRLGGTNKIGEWNPKGEYVPREGYEHIVPELAPRVFS